MHAKTGDWGQIPFHHIYPEIIDTVWLKYCAYQEPQVFVEEERKGGRKGEKSYQ